MDNMYLHGLLLFGELKSEEDPKQKLDKEREETTLAFVAMQKFHNKRSDISSI